MTVVVIGSAAEEIAVDNAGLVDERSAANLQIEPALGDGRHSPSLDTSSPRGNLDTMADAANGFVCLEEVLRDALVNWFSLAKNNDESLKISIGLLDENKLTAQDDLFAQSEY